MDYSQAELRLFTHFHQEKLIANATSGYILYSVLVHLAFTHPERYSARFIFALRAAVILMDEKPCRMTEEFDRAILDNIDGFIPESSVEEGE